MKNFLKKIRLTLIADVPVEYQACEACREPNCSTKESAICEVRIRGQLQETDARRKVFA